MLMAPILASSDSRKLSATKPPNYCIREAHFEPGLAQCASYFRFHPREPLATSTESQKMESESKAENGIMRLTN